MALNVNYGHISRPGGGSGGSGSSNLGIDNHGGVSVGAAETIDRAQGYRHVLVLGEDAEITLTTSPTGGDYQEMFVRFVQDSTGGRAITWASGDEPTPSPEIVGTADAVTDLLIFTDDGGATWGASQVIRAITSLNIDDLADPSTPSVLTIGETTGTVISNHQTTPAAHVFTMPAAHLGGFVTFTKGDANQIDIEPVSGDNFYLNGTAMATDEHIQNTATDIGGTIVGWCADIGGTLTWLFKSDDDNWVEASP